MKKLISSGVLLSVALALTVVSTSGFADTGFTKQAENKIFASNGELIETVASLRTIAKLKLVDGLDIAATDECGDTDTVPCMSTITDNRLASNWPPLPANSLTRSLHPELETLKLIRLQPG